MNIELLLKALLAGGFAGVLFAALKLPIPAPNALAGVVGIIGIYLGFLLYNKFF